MYSFTRGRPPSRRGRIEPGGSATPGARATREMKLRPFRGSCTTSRLAITWPTSERSVFRRGTSAVTVALSVNPPASRTTSTRARSPVLSTRPSRSVGPEARGFRLQPIASGTQGRKDEEPRRAGGGGHPRPVSTSTTVTCSSGHEGARGVAHLARDLAPTRLGPGRRRAYQERRDGDGAGAGPGRECHF